MEGSIEAKLDVSQSKEWKKSNVKKYLITFFFEDVRFVVHLLEFMSNDVCMNMHQVKVVVGQMQKDT